MIDQTVPRDSKDFVKKIVKLLSEVMEENLKSCFLTYVREHDNGQEVYCWGRDADIAYYNLMMDKAKLDLLKRESIPE